MFTARSKETLIFSAALVLAALHAVDDAFLHRQPGVGLGQHALAGLISLVAAAAGLYAFPRVRPGVKAVMSLAFGIPAVVNGAMHAAHIHFDAPANSDITGVLALLAGVALIALGAVIPWLHRGEMPQRWRNRAIAVPGTLVVLLFVVGPVGMAIFETHKPRERVGDPPTAAFQDVEFDSADGLRLKGWYRPTRNGATVLLVHGGGGDRTGAMDHAKMLDRHGYGILMYDSRGRGESEGSPNSYGWDWEKDAAGALDWLATRPEVDPDRLGGLGLSSGADTLIDVAATRDDLKAVVSDGAAGRTLEDFTRVNGVDPLTVSGWLMFQAVGVTTGDGPSRPLEDLVEEIHEPLLLVSAGTALEKDANDLFAEVANEPFEHWNMPDAHHTGGVRDEPRAYEEKITSFLEENLLTG